MISFDTYKFEAEQWLAHATNTMTAAHRRALYVIVELAERGRELEAENADLKNQLRDALERC